MEIQTNLISKDSSHFKMTSQDLLLELNTIIYERYNFPIENFTNYKDLLFIKTSNDKISFLREICKILGLKLAPKKYLFDNMIPDSHLSFKDITGFSPKTKSAQFYTDILKHNNKAIENEIIQKNFQGAL